jgi:histidine phosphotransfer protein HptB
MSKIRSTLASDPQFKELVSLFVAEIPQRVATIEMSLQAEDLARLKTLVHQLKGACGGYGFPMISLEAEALESHLNSLHVWDKKDIDDVVRKFVEMLNQMSAE